MEAVPKLQFWNSLKWFFCKKNKKPSFFPLTDPWYFDKILVFILGYYIKYLVLV
jgi:hypothetical protein